MRGLSVASWIALSFAAPSASSQCLDWSPAFGAPGQGANDLVLSLGTFDRGAGTELGLGGWFETAGTVPARGIASWSGSSWSAFGAGLTDVESVGVARAWAVFDDGNGPALYVAGSFTHADGVPVGHLARWDGSAWSSVGGGLSYHAFALAVFDDGGGPALYVGGAFGHAGGQPIANLARWDGSSFSAVGGGVIGAVNALAVFDDGGGPGLFATGLLTAAGGVPVARIAKWDGSAWSPLGSGLSAAPHQKGRALAVFDDGSGPALYVGGNFPHAGSGLVRGVARWNGVNWTALGAGLFDVGGDAEAWTLAVADLGSGPRLFAAGQFLHAGSVPAAHVAAWDGSTWSALGSGIDGIPTALATYDDGNGPALFACGHFTNAGDVATGRVARWDGSVWSGIGPGGLGASGDVEALEHVDFGAGPELYAGGSFVTIGTTIANGIARWTGDGWSALGAGVENAGVEGVVRAITALDDGDGVALYAGGSFDRAGSTACENVARWDGDTWTALGPGLDDDVRALATFDDGGGRALYAGGRFTISGSSLVRGIARWTGSAWAPVGGGVASDQSVLVHDLMVHDDGSGQALYVAGRFSSAGGVPAQNIARWNGVEWSAVGSGFSNDVHALALHDDGNGPALFAAGVFGGQNGMRVSRWNGSAWSPLAGTSTFGFGGAYALASFDDGSGSALHAAGRYSISFTEPRPGVARTNGTSWLPLGAGIGSDNLIGPRALAVHDIDADGAPDLVVGGNFGSAGGLAASSLAVWRGCPGPGTRFCFGELGALPCPCANTGLYERGCDNSSATGGAGLFASGTSAPDTVVLAASGELASALSIFLQGDAESAGGIAFGDGIRCVGGTLKRLAVRNASGGAVSYPGAGDPSISATSAALGDPIAPGTTRSYQTYYRDPDLAFCPAPSGNSWNVTNAVRIGW